MMLLQKPSFNFFLVSLATGFGVGRLKSAPGTWGSMAALPLAVFFMFLPVLHMIFCVLGFILAILSAQAYLNKCIGAEGGLNSDPSEVVVDEMLGVLISLVWLPVSITSVGLAFLLFRLLDILKPFPISWFDKNGKGGVGIVADDVVAGILTNIGIHYMVTQGWLL
jgi:phosphatidylglycerophosphatase A